MSKNQFNALRKTVECIRAKEIIISIIENESNSFLDSEHWLFKDTTSYSQYIKLPIYLENSIYFQIGKWGILISHEEHAVIGGNENFINMWQYNKANFNSDVEWISRFLNHMSF